MPTQQEHMCCWGPVLSSPQMASSPSSGLPSPPLISPMKHYMMEKAFSTRRSPENRKSGGSKLGSKYRGVTHHARTNRYESHIWDDGRQVYLGGFYNETQAALAYDLAAVRFRGEDAILNFPRGLYGEELGDRHTVTQEQVVSCLREQSKAMNKVDQSSNSVSMQAWELQISHLINPTKCHIGVYSSEVEAARAYDRALVNSLGIDAGPLLNFQLVEYIDALDASQVAAAMQRGFIPSVLPQSYSPSCPPTPIYQVESPTRQQVSPTDHANPSEEGEQSPELNNSVRRRTSNTPRSVLDFGCGSDCAEEVGDKRSQPSDVKAGCDELSPQQESKRRKVSEQQD